MKIKEFLEYEAQARNLSVLTVRNYREWLRCFYVYAAQAGKDVDDLTCEEIVDILRTERQRGLSPASCNFKLTAIRCYYDYLCRFQGKAENQAVRVERMRQPSFLPKYIPEHVLKNLLDGLSQSSSFQGVRSYALIAFFYMTGARCSEVAALDDSSLDFFERRVLLTGKGNKQRCVPVCQHLEDILRKYMAMRDVQGFSRHSALFCSVSGARLTHWQLRIIVAQALARVVPKPYCHPHILRHSFATILLNHGKPIEHISRWLGHTSIAVTQRYLTIVSNPQIDNFNHIF